MEAARREKVQGLRDEAEKAKGRIQASKDKAEMQTKDAQYGRYIWDTAQQQSIWSNDPIE